MLSLLSPRNQVPWKDHADDKLSKDECPGLPTGGVVTEVLHHEIVIGIFVK
jgi:hypothetical protein